MNNYCLANLLLILFYLSPTTTMNSDLATSEDENAIYLAPSTIHCIDPLGNEKVAPCSVRPHHDVVSSSSSSITESERHIRLEAVEVDGRWFALDRDQLEFYQRLEQEGGCRRVRVEPVSITLLPDETKAKIDQTVASINNGAIPDTPVIQGYQILGEGGKVDNALTDSAVADTDHHSDSSADEDDSSSECDWSEDEGDSSDENSDEEAGRKQRTLADGKSDSSSDENEHLLGEDS